MIWSGVAFRYEGRLYWKLWRKEHVTVAEAAEHLQQWVCPSLLANETAYVVSEDRQGRRRVWATFGTTAESQVR